MDNQEIKIEGMYEFDSSGDEIAYILKFSGDSNLIGNCTGNKEEYLYLANNGTTLLSNWWTCDGPGLFYKLVSIK